MKVREINSRARKGWDSGMGAGGWVGGAKALLFVFRKLVLVPTAVLKWRGNRCGLCPSSERQIA